MSALACSPALDENNETDEGELQGSDAPSEWTLPRDVERIGLGQSVRVDEDPPWDPKLCAKALTPGALALRADLRARFAGIVTIGGLNCRQSTGPQRRMSVHGTGRALDVHFKELARGVADSDNGDVVANWLVVNAAKLGVQFIIWNRVAWRPNGAGASRYVGDSAHTDHVHLELDEDAAGMRVPAQQTPASETPSVVEQEPSGFEEEGQ